ncbi:MAG: hypothetical protein MOGMAGMI_02081 [Candidatus Omnitrophica bacterium]|nr:hypothetical protein [Candidatus Omnitrophota bacterium]
MRSVRAVEAPGDDCRTLRRGAGGVFCAAWLILCLAGQAAGAERTAAVAGTFYPADASELTALLKTCEIKAPVSSAVSGRPPRALIVPHAGYVYSGRTAAAAYRTVRGADIDTVVLIGPSHHAVFRGASIWTEGDWITPLGRMAVDTDLARAIAADNTSFAHPPDPHLNEHSLEVQLPFLQRVLPKARIVPILTSDPSPANTSALAESVLRHTAGRKALIVFSTDMSHYRDLAPTYEMDRRTLELIRSGDTAALYRALADGTSELCGAAAVLTALETARRLPGGGHLEVLDYTTSADAGGGHHRVVGYGAVILTDAGAAPVSAPRSGNEVGVYGSSQRQELLWRARSALQRRLAGRSGELTAPSDPLLLEPRAVFVTLRNQGQLRGCIGGLYASEPLYRAVEHMAQAAARDPRFRRVRPQELEELHIEISVLSPPERIANADAIELGHHGVIVRRGEAGGVFLPQVATETGWSRERFLSELCTQKAGLAADCWKDPDTELYTFTCEIFEEPLDLHTESST